MVNRSQWNSLAIFLGTRPPFAQYCRLRGAQSAYKSTDYLKPCTWLPTIIDHTVCRCHRKQGNGSDGNTQVPYYDLRWIYYGFTMDLLWQIYSHTMAFDIMDLHAPHQLSDAMALQSRHCCKEEDWLLMYLKSLLDWIWVSVLHFFALKDYFQISFFKAFLLSAHNAKVQEHRITITLTGSTNRRSWPLRKTISCMRQLKQWSTAIQVTSPKLELILNMQYTSFDNPVIQFSNKTCESTSL